MRLARERVRRDWRIADAVLVVEDKGYFLEVRDAGVDGVAVGLGIEAIAVCGDVVGGPGCALLAAVGEEGGITSVCRCVTVQCTVDCWDCTTAEGKRR